MQIHLVWFFQTCLLHLQIQSTHLLAVQRNVNLDFVRLNRLPTGVEGFARAVLHRYAVHTGNDRRIQVHRVFSAHDQRVLVGRCQGPLLRMSAGEMKGWSFERLKTPIAMQRSGHGGSQLLRIQDFRVEDKSALHGIGRCWNVNALASLVLHSQNKIMRIASGKNIRRSHHREHQWLGLCAQGVLGIDRMDHREVCRLDCGQPHHQHRLRLVKRWRIVQLE